jgi:hypothetical protein
MRALFAVLLAAAAAVACVKHDPSRPLGAIDAYVAALEVGDYDKAYDLMSDAYKRDHTREEYVRMMKENPSDVRETAKRLKKGRKNVAVTAVYTYDDLRDEMKLVEEDGRWRIASDPLDFYPQDTPRACLRSFLRAVELRRYDVLVRFVPKDYAMTEEQIRAQFEGEQKQDVADLVAKLRGAIDNKIDVEGDQARMLYGDNKEVLFRREDGVWKIEDFR